MTDEILNLLTESVNLLIVGMVVVFVFLTVLIGAVKLMSTLAQKFPEQDVIEPNASNQVASTLPKNEQVPPQIIAAISAAVNQYRQK